MSDFAIPWTAACQASLSFTISQSLLKSCPSNQWCHPTISSSVAPFSCPQSFPASGFFSSELALLIRWPKYWSFSISPFSEYSGMISFRMDWLDLLVVQGTRECSPQHHNRKASILWYSALFMVQLSHLYMATGNTMALTIVELSAWNIYWSESLCEN